MFHLTCLQNVSICQCNKLRGCLKILCFILNAYKMCRFICQCNKLSEIVFAFTFTRALLFSICMSITISACCCRGRITWYISYCAKCCATVCEYFFYYLLKDIYHEKYVFLCGVDDSTKIIMNIIVLKLICMLLVWVYKIVCRHYMFFVSIQALYVFCQYTHICQYSSVFVFV